MQWPLASGLGGSLCPECPSPRWVTLQVKSRWIFFTVNSLPWGLLLAMPIGYPKLKQHSPSPNLIFTRPQRGLTQEGEGTNVSILVHNDPKHFSKWKLLWGFCSLYHSTLGNFDIRLCQMINSFWKLVFINKIFLKFSYFLLFIYSSLKNDLARISLLLKIV